MDIVMDGVLDFVEYVLKRGVRLAGAAAAPAQNCVAAWEAIRPRGVRGVP